MRCTRRASRKQRAHDMTPTRPCTRSVVHAKYWLRSRCSKPSHRHRTNTWHFAARLPAGVPQLKQQLPHGTRRHDTTRIHDVLPQVYVCTMTNLDGRLVHVSRGQLVASATHSANMCPTLSVSFRYDSQNMVTARLLFGDRVLKNLGACIVMRSSSRDHAKQPVEGGSGVQRCWGNGMKQVCAC